MPGESGYGQHDANWLAFCDFFFEVCGLVQATQKLQGLWKISKNAGWFLPHEKTCWVSERHCVVKRDPQNRLHCEDGIALAYPDGWGIYAWHGVRLPAYIIEEPSKITIEFIEKEENAEIRRVMIERYGQAKYLLDSGAQKIHEDDFGILYRKEIKDDEPLIMVKVVNSTPEPDGSFKDYFIRVSPDCKTAKGACAWTFSKTEAEYELAVQT